MIKKLLSAIAVAILPLCVLPAQEYRLSTPNTTLIVNNDNGVARLVYYGPKVDESTSTNDMRAARMTFDRESYYAFGVHSNEERALAITQPDGSLTLDLKVEGIKKTSDADGTTIEIDMKDKVYPLYVRQYFKAFNGTDIISTWTDIVNSAKKSVALEMFASAQIPIARSDNYITHFHGGWAAECFMNEQQITDGQIVVSNKYGIQNTHADNPSVMISVGGKATENSGTVFGGALAWSGNYKIKARAAGGSQLEVLAGINEETSRYILDGGKTFTTPEFIMTYSTEGKGGVSRAFHRWARKYALAHGDQERMILLNSWEGVYFNIDEKTMDQMMGDIASLGGELFVMDDGWFGDKYPRDNDHTSLGDWMVCKKKLPNGIKALTDDAKKHNIKFGIWIEPEMINTKSELFEKHPDWALSSPNRPLTQGRGGTQMVLDLTNPKVQDYVYSVFDNVMTQTPEIAYIKWDANANIMNYGSHYLKADRQSQIFIDYQLGLRSVLKRLRAKYPNVVVQACAGGGGRVNYGLLPFFDEYWTSDDTDAFQRLFIQWGTSHFYPAIGMGSHVSATPNHQTGRVTPLKFRFDVAMQGRLGMELQPKNMNDKEKEFAKRAIAAYKDVRRVVQMGDLYRLNSPYDNDYVTSLMYSSEDKSKAVFYVYRDHKVCTIQNDPLIRLDGVDENKNYKFTDITPLDPNRPHWLSGKVISGRALKKAGIRVNLDGDFSSVVFKLEAVN